MKFISVPVKTSILRLGNHFASKIGVTTPSSIPNCVSIPRVISIKKKSIDHNDAFGIVLMASVNVMNAKPVLAGGFCK